MMAQALAAFEQVRYGEELALLWLLCLWQWEQRDKVPGEVGMAYRQAFVRLTDRERQVAHSELVRFGLVEGKGAKS